MLNKIYWGKSPGAQVESTIPRGTGPPQVGALRRGALGGGAARHHDSYVDRLQYGTAVLLVNSTGLTLALTSSVFFFYEGFFFPFGSSEKISSGKIYCGDENMVDIVVSKEDRECMQLTHLWLP